MTRFTASDTTLLKSHARPGSASVMSMPRAREAGSGIEGKGTGAPPNGGAPERFSVLSGQALLGDVREHMDVLGVDTHADRRATVRRKPRVDARDDLLGVELGVVGEAGERAIDVRVGAELLDDRHVDPDALVGHRERLGADAQGERLLADSFGKELALDRDVEATDGDAALDDWARHEGHRRRAGVLGSPALNLMSG